VQLLVEYESEQSLEINCESSVDTEKTTPLQDAAALGNKDIVLCLLEHGADVDKQNSKGRTALHRAVWKSQKEATEALIECGANLDIQDSTGKTALHWAGKDSYNVTHTLVFFKSIDIVKMLVTGGANTEILDKTNYTAEQIARNKNLTEFIEYFESQKT
jgi:serine/threonine-protein phosphatase 6 regulatory ankyrin repeat subunit A/serine/threonine-protein phosphatase 6 regulatory ankyrin repeat subunit B